MTRNNLMALSLLLPLAAPLAAQTRLQDRAPSIPAADTTPAARPADTRDAKKALLVPAIQIDRLRPNDQRGINVFEGDKASTVPFTGFKLALGAAFTQQFQGLDHENASTATTPLVKIGNGFNNAVANLYVNAQLAKGVRVAMASYLSSRHHNETWVKDGYFLIDDSPIDHPLLNTVMRYVTIRAGHLEVNYGDAHFRRTDNGQAMFNPLVGNYVMDAFTTEIGGEVYLRRGGAFLMGGAFAGESKGMVQKPEQRAPAFLGKVGFDKQVTPLVRVRLTGSAFSQAQATSQTLYAGDRAGSRYYSVVETNTDEKAAFTSGAINPGVNSIHAYVINPFVTVGGLELFGNIETSNGRARGETTTRKWAQNVGEVTYRLFGDALYLSGRYNAVKGRLAGYTDDVEIDRSQLGGGWFITPTVLLKGEWVNQKYDGFETTDVRSGAKFKGFTVEGVVAF